MDSSSLEERLEQLADLPATPIALARLMSALGDPDVEVEEIAKIVATDQALSLAVMKYANSAEQAGALRVASLKDALTRLGMQNLRRLVLAQQSALLFERASEGFALQPRSALQGALAGGIGADILARRVGDCDPSAAFTAGILRDCGKLAMDLLVGSEELANALDSGAGESIPEREREAFGFDHAEAGAALAKLWGLPEELCLAIRFHHEPAGAPGNRLVQLVHCGDMAAAQLGYGVGLDGLTYTFDEEVCAEVGLDLQTMCELLIEVRTELQVFESYLGSSSENQAA